MENLPVLSENALLLYQLYDMPADEILERILGHESPRKLIRTLSSQDFFWLIKKIGEEDCLPILELASEEQWQYLLDLEIWQKDRLDIKNASLWLRRLKEADLQRFALWLENEGEEFLSFLLSKISEVIVVKAGDSNSYDLPAGFFSPDGVFYIRAIREEDQDTLEALLKVISQDDFKWYQEFLIHLAGNISSEMEEEMYRIKNVRLAEHGFLPYEEAISVYAPLGADALRIEKPPELPGIFFDRERRDLIPLSPLIQIKTHNMLTEAISGISDPLLLDRLRLEFAALCNRILSAEGLTAAAFDVLAGVCGRAAGYLNLGMEEAGKHDPALAETILKMNPLLAIFRVGFGLVLKLKWEAERWRKQSWFYSKGWPYDFWGERWGGTLSGLFAYKPVFYAGLSEHGQYGDFAALSDLDESRMALQRVIILDKLLRQLAEQYPLDKDPFHGGELNFYRLLFNFWSRLLLKLDPGFTRIPLKHLKTLFCKLRAGDEKPPYRMPGMEITFINDFLGYTPSHDSAGSDLLRDTLSLLWREFSEEYAWVSISDLDGRYSKFL